MLLAHPTGFVEIYLGEVDGAKIELRTDVVARTETAKEYTAGHRLYGLVEGELMWAYDMAAVGQPLQPHLSAQLRAGLTVAEPRDDRLAARRCGRAGYRLTPQRQLVLEAVTAPRARHARGDPAPRSSAPQTA